jgi:hypothetical protein
MAPVYCNPKCASALSSLSLEALLPWRRCTITAGFRRPCRSPSDGPVSCSLYLQQHASLRHHVFSTCLHPVPPYWGTDCAPEDSGFDSQKCTASRLAVMHISGPISVTSDWGLQPTSAESPDMAVNKQRNRSALYPPVCIVPSSLPTHWRWVGKLEGTMQTEGYKGTGLHCTLQFAYSSAMRTRVLRTLAEIFPCKDV